MSWIVVPSGEKLGALIARRSHDREVASIQVLVLVYKKVAGTPWQRETWYLFCCPLEAVINLSSRSVYPYICRWFRQAATKWGFVSSTPLVSGECLPVR